MASSARRFVSNPVSNPSSLGTKIGNFEVHLRIPPENVHQKDSCVFYLVFSLGKQGVFQAMQLYKGLFQQQKHTENTDPSQLWRDDDLAFSLVKSVPSLPEDQGSLISSRCHKNNTNPNHALFIREIHQKYVKKYSIRLYTIHLHQVRSPQKDGWHSMILEKKNSTQKIVKHEAPCISIETSITSLHTSQHPEMWIERSSTARPTILLHDFMWD